MMRERVFLGDEALAIELDADGRYRLAYGDGVEYTPGKRRLRGRTLPYEFRSVEQLRYDFERDAEAAGGVIA